MTERKWWQIWVSTTWIHGEPDNYILIPIWEAPLFYAVKLVSR